MFFARKRVVFDNSPSFSDRSTFRFGETPMDKLVIAISGDSAILVFAENNPPTFENPFDTEVELDEGTHSISFRTPITGMMIRAANTSIICTFRLTPGHGSTAPDTYTKDVSIDTSNLEALLETLITDTQLGPAGTWNRAKHLWGSWGEAKAAAATWTEAKALVN